MAIDYYKTDIEFDLHPNCVGEPPRVCITLDGETLWDDVLYTTNSFFFSPLLCRDQHALEIELYDKPDLDPHQNLQISNLNFGKIQSHRFVWQSVYRPRYPEPWASQQKSNGQLLPAAINSTDHLGWNGIWRLEFTVPIFTWIHQVENLGWIYD